MTLKRDMALLGIAALSTAMLSGCMGRPGAKMQEAGGFVGYMFDKVDANGDGFVDKNEYMAFSDERFAKFDDNGDGNVTLTEFNQSRFAEFAPAMAEDLFSRYDSNNDDVVTKEEMVQKEEANFSGMAVVHADKFTKKEMIVFYKKERFKRLDRDSDGCISQQEYVNAKSPFER